MIKHLYIQNYALIERLDLDFDKAFTVITGETGAGKSIIIGAIGLIRGNRADSQVLFDTSKKCIVEATFDISNYKLENEFNELQLDYESNTVIRREISNIGKSRAFINDTPVNLQTLKQLSEKLIDIHSQHETLSLNDAQFQIDFIDSFAGINEKITDYRKIFNQYRENDKKLEIQKELYHKNKQDLDYLKFQYDELEKAQFNNPNEQLELESELQLLSHAEEIKGILNLILQQLSESEPNITGVVKQAAYKLEKSGQLHPSIKTLASRMASIAVEMDDISMELNQLNTSIDYSPSRIEEVSKRLDLIYRIEQKHSCRSITEIISLKEKFLEKINEIDKSENSIDVLTKKSEELKAMLMQLAFEISDFRKKAIPEIEKRVMQSLEKLGMKDSIFKIAIENTETPSNNGIDRIRYLFSANKGASINDVSRVASGGELSRLMLSIKSLVSERNLLSTIIFDEIDMGISGEIANKMGEVLRNISEKIQLIAITHLPQIAGKAQNHLWVNKESIDNKTISTIKRLNDDERIVEIAKMISGNNFSDATLATARQMLSIN